MVLMACTGGDLALGLAGAKITYPEISRAKFPNNLLFIH